MAGKLVEIKVGSVVVLKKEPVKKLAVMDTMKKDVVGTVRINLEDDNFKVVGMVSTTYLKDVKLTPRVFPHSLVGEKILEYYQVKLGGQTSENMKTGITNAVNSPPRKVRIDLE